MLNLIVYDIGFFRLPVCSVLLFLSGEIFFKYNLVLITSIVWGKWWEISPRCIKKILMNIVEHKGNGVQEEVCLHSGPSRGQLKAKKWKERKKSTDNKRIRTSPHVWAALLVGGGVRVYLMHVSSCRLVRSAKIRLSQSVNDVRSPVPVVSRHETCPMMKLI